MERDSGEASDFGRDLRDVGDEPAGSFRDTAPDILSPIDETSPISGHHPVPDHAAAPSIADSPEQSWEAQRRSCSRV